MHTFFRWFRRRRLAKLYVERAGLQGEIAAHHSAGYALPSACGRLAEVNERIRQITLVLE